jgi:L-iditol 2-dehydrogenase
MGKGGMSHGEAKDGEEENMAAWLLGINTLKIQPFKLPSLGITFINLFFASF